MSSRKFAEILSLRQKLYAELLMKSKKQAADDLTAKRALKAEANSLQDRIEKLKAIFFFCSSDVCHTKMRLIAEAIRSSSDTNSSPWAMLMLICIAIMLDLIWPCTGGKAQLVSQFLHRRRSTANAKKWLCQGDPDTPCRH